MNKNKIKKILSKDFMNILSLSHSIYKKYNNSFDMCSIINAKCGACSEDCKFCAQSVHFNTNIEQYPLISKELILEAAKKAKGNGAKRFGIVTSGKSLTNEEIDQITDVISIIKGEIGLTSCASLGELTENQLLQLKDAGLTRYHHNIETSEAFYPNIVSTHKFEDRIRTIKMVKKLGLQACSGGIIGLGESMDDRIDMALTLKELNVDSVPINILVPIKGTPLETQTPLNILEILKTIAMFRIVLKDKTIKIAAGRESVLKDFQVLAFLAGANSMIIGGYLTVQGRSVEEDQRMVKELVGLLQN